MQSLEVSQSKKVRRRVLAISFVLFLVLTGPVVAAAENAGSVETVRQIGKAFARIAQKTSPAVVWITSERMVTQDHSALRRSPFGHQRDPFGDDFFEFFFGPRYRQRQRPAPKPQSVAGSGFIVSKDGYILTNNHVVKDSDKIKVKLMDEREFEAKVIGADPDSDVAVVKIDANDLPILELGDSDVLEVGEWVLAIGNPLGLSHTVTAGIVSAKGRSGLRLAKYEDYIQTDAAINRGNSGGPLINLDGKAIGINTAIMSPTGGNLGIGFAIPVNMAKSVYKQLIESGTVVRGFLGVVYAELTPKLATAFGLDEDTKGAVISEIVTDSAAEKAGLKHNDIIIKFEGTTIEKSETFRNKVAMLKPGKEVEIVVLRDGKKKKFKVKLGKRPGWEGTARGESKALEKVGFSVKNLTDDLAERLGYEGLKGVVVSEVKADSLAALGGIRAGVLIMEVNQEPIKNAKEFKKAVEKAVKEGQVLLLIKEGRFSRYIVLSIPKK